MLNFVVKNDDENATKYLNQFVYIYGIQSFLRAYDLCSISVGITDNDQKSKSHMSGPVLNISVVKNLYQFSRKLLDLGVWVDSRTKSPNPKMDQRNCPHGRLRKR